MRSIGKRNIKKVKDLTLQTMVDGAGQRNRLGVEAVTEIVREKLSADLWDIWEGADQEINRIIWDTVMESI